MLESLVKFNEIKERPWLMFLWALLISSVGIVFGYEVSYNVTVSGTTLKLAGIFSVLFTIIPAVYFLTMYIKREEGMDERDIEKHYEKGFWEREEKDIMVLLFFFAGLTVSYALWAVYLPADTFQIQIMKVQDIRSSTGNFIGHSGQLMSGYASGNEYSRFIQILENNLWVTSFAFVFSLIFGAGAIFIIVWNASILGAYIGRLSESFFHIPIVSLNFLPHGIPEIAGYIIAGISGSLISAAVLRGHKDAILFGIFRDSMKLLGLALLFVFLGAVIEAMGFTARIIAIFIFYTIFIYIITIAFVPYAKRKAAK
ncbi:MAG: stage II sporulation protein M [Candidatus Aenigmarchaeota archaeon]|nr:stage II sporulation protein M [Candidatus Aenigmarchaeota archaeon]